MNDRGVCSSEGSLSPFLFQREMANKTLVLLSHFFLKRSGQENTPECYFLFEEKVTKENFPESNPTAWLVPSVDSCDFITGPKSSKGRNRKPGWFADPRSRRFGKAMNLVCSCSINLRYRNGRECGMVTFVLWKKVRSPIGVKELSMH